MNGRDLILTGIPRSGTSLCCSLLNDVPNTIALLEPMQVMQLPLDHPGAVQAIQGFFENSRSNLLRRGEAWSHHNDGAVPDNSIADAAPGDSLRGSRVKHGLIAVDKPLSTEFSLVIKHNAAFTALLPELGDVLPCHGIVRNPVSVLGSWSSVDLPVGKGRIPAAERLDEPLRGALDAQPSTFERQLHIIDWFFRRFRDVLSREHVIRYEDVVSSHGRALGEALSIGLPGRALTSRNSSMLYRGDHANVWASTLLARDGAWRAWYSEQDIIDAAAQLGNSPT